MTDNNFEGISREGEPLDTDRDIEGVKQGQQLLKGDSETLVEGIERGPEDITDVLLPGAGKNQGGSQQSDLIGVLYELFRRQAQLEESRIRSVSDRTTSAGRSTAAAIEKGPRRKEFEIFYDLQTGNGEIAIDVSLDGSSWKPYASLTVPSGGDRDIATGSTVFSNVRAYPGSQFNDTDVNEIQIVSAGDG